MQAERYSSMSNSTPAHDAATKIGGALLAVAFVAAVVGAVYWLLSPGPFPSPEEQVTRAVDAAIKERPRLLRQLRAEMERHREAMRWMIPEREAMAFANAPDSERPKYGPEFRKAYRERDDELLRHRNALSDLGFDEKSAWEFLRG